MEQNHEEGSHLYAPQSSAGESCAAAVKYWGEIKRNVETLPPAYFKDVLPYHDHRNISSVGLFNTSANLTIDCAVMNCRNLTGDDNTKDGSGTPGGTTTSSSTAPPTTTTTPSTTQKPPTTPTTVDSSGTSGTPSELQAPASSSRRLSSASDSTYSLICLSSPQALKQGKAPFNEEQWAKIKSLENSSTQAKVVPLFASVTRKLLIMIS
ncbi:hypothetical protein Esti_005291 [Eimeria stiedai]